MNTKQIPLFLMLLAGAITSVITYVFRYDTKSMLTILLVVLFIFYVLGLIVKKILDVFEKQIEEAKAKEGEVIEKELAEKAEAESDLKEEQK